MLSFILSKCIQPAIFLVIFLVFSGCRKEPAFKGEVTSPEYDGELLYVTKTGYQIATSEAAEFSSEDTLITISKAGLILRIPSGEVCPIDIKWPKSGNKTTRIYAVGATVTDLGETAIYANYRKGWETLKEMPNPSKTYAIVLRHADADIGIDYNLQGKGEGPDNWWKSSDPAYARQLNQRGIDRATSIGQIFKELGFPITRTVTTEFYRAQHTLTLIEKGINTGLTPVVDYRLNHPDYNIYEPGLFMGMVENLKNQPLDNKLTLLVCHHPVNAVNDNGIGIYSNFPAVSPFEWCSAFVVSISADRSLTYEGAISYGMFKHWRDLKMVIK